MDPPKRLDLGYSLKNIPIPSPTAYTTRLIEKVEDLIKRMRWRAFFFLKNEQAEEEQDRKERFGFRTRKCPPRIEELEAFENDLLKIIEDLQFRKTSNELQERLRQDTERIKKSKDVIVPADKTRNLYAVGKTRYEKLLCENITKAYKPAPARTYDEINYVLLVRRPKPQKVLRSEVTLPPSVNKTIDSRLDRGKHFESNCACWQSQTAADCEKRRFLVDRL